MARHFTIDQQDETGEGFFDPAERDTTLPLPDLNLDHPDGHGYGFGPDAALPAAEITAGLDRAALADLADRAAAAWVGNLDRPEGDDDEFIDYVVEQLGFDGFIALLSVSERSRLLAASLSASLFLHRRTEDILATTRTKRKLLEAAADEPYQAILHGRLEEAAASLSLTLTNLAESLEKTLVYSKRNPRLAARSHTLAADLTPVRDRLTAARDA